VDVRLETVPRRTTDDQRVVAGAGVSDDADVEVDGGRNSDDGGHGPDDGKCYDGASQTNGASGWSRYIMTPCRQNTAHTLDGDDHHCVDTGRCTEYGQHVSQLALHVGFSARTHKRIIYK